MASVASADGLVGSACWVVTCSTVLLDHVHCCLALVALMTMSGSVAVTRSKLALAAKSESSRFVGIRYIRPLSLLAVVCSCLCHCGAWITGGMFVFKKDREKDLFLFRFFV